MKGPHKRKTGKNIKLNLPKECVRQIKKGRLKNKSNTENKSGENSGANQQLE